MTNNPSGITPMNGYVLVAPVKVEEKTAGGVLLPESHRERQEYGTQTGKVLAVATDVADFAAGETVVFPRYAGGGVVFPGNDGEKYMLILDDDIRGKISGV